MKQQIKAGDYVYIPTYSLKALKVMAVNGKLRAFFNGDMFICLKENGLSSSNHINPIAFLATPANKERIERFYGCRLENPPIRMATISIPHDNS